MLRTSQVVSATAAAVALLAAPAVAQVPAGGQFTGGSLSASTRSSVAGVSELAVTVSADGTRVRVRGSGAVRCNSRGDASEVTGRGTASLAPDGSFSATLKPGRQLRQPGFKSTMKVTGKVAPA